jgi:teichuronic acid biosynthesis glycosyltransferase TuaC
MHVLIVPSWYPTRDNLAHGSFFREQARALKDAGMQVGVIAPQLRSLRVLKKARLGWPKGLEYWEDDGVSTWMQHGWGWLPRVPHGLSHLWLKAGHALFEHYVSAHGMPDLVHAHSALYGGVLAARIKRRCAVPYVLTEHSTSFARRIIRRWQVPLVKTALEQADTRMVVSPMLGELLESQYGEAARPWRWVPNMVDRSFRPGRSASAADHGAGFRFLNVAFLTEKKGQADLLRAMALAFKGDGDVQLRIGGAGPCMGRLVRLAERLGIRDQVAFLGHVERETVLAEMQSCNCFVLSSRHETFGVVLIEALACGKPVVATVCGGPECVVHSGNGRLVRPGEERALAEAMLDVRDRIAAYDGDFIRRDCLARFGEQAVVRELLPIYEEAAGSGARLTTRKERAA